MLWSLQPTEFYAKYQVYNLSITNEIHPNITPQTHYKHLTICSKSLYYIPSLILLNTGKCVSDTASIEKAQEALLSYKIHFWLKEQTFADVLDILQNLYENNKDVKKYFIAFKIKHPLSHPERPDIVFYCRPQLDENGIALAHSGLRLLMNTFSSEMGSQVRNSEYEMIVNDLISYAGGNHDDKSIIKSDKHYNMNDVYDISTGYALYKGQNELM